MKYKILLILIAVILSLPMFSQTSGELSVTVTTSETGGNYAPKNIVAIWVEDDQGNFVKTLLAYAQNRRTHLNTWQASTATAGTEYNTTDAITGATRSSHSTRSCTWDGTDFNGFQMADGIYYLWLELTDKNTTGNYSSFQFTKGVDDQNLNPEDAPSFASISINWDAIIASVSVANDYADISIHPNPGNGIFTICGDNIEEVEVRTIFGELVLRSASKTFDITNQHQGTYIVTIRTKTNQMVKKIIKK